MLYFDVLNVIAARAILSNTSIDPDTAARSSLAAGLIPGALGLALPLVVARNQGGAPPGTQEILVPDVTTGRVSVADATTKLQSSRLVAVEVRAFSADVDKDFVVSQDPAAKSLVPLDSNVTIVVSDGKPSDKPPPVVDIDQDLTQKLNAAKVELEAQIAASEQRLKDAIAAIPGGYAGSGLPNP